MDSYPFPERSDNPNALARRPVPDAIGADPDERYTRLVRRTKSRDDSRAKMFSRGMDEGGAQRQGDQEQMNRGSFSGAGPQGEPTNVAYESFDNRNAPTSPPQAYPPPTQQGPFVSLLPFNSGPYHPNIVAPAPSWGVPEPPPTYSYTGRGRHRGSATDPIQQRAQFEDPVHSYPPEQYVPEGPKQEYELRKRGPGPGPESSTYYGAPPNVGFFDRYGHPGRMNTIQPPARYPYENGDDDWDEDEEKDRLANYHAQADWDPDDEYYDPEPSVAARRPFSETTLSGYRPPAPVLRRGELGGQGKGRESWDTRSQTTIVVESEKGKKQYITENICPMEQRRSFILVLSKALLQFQAPSHRIENQLSAAARVLDVPAEFLHLPSLVIVSFGSLDGEKGAPVMDKQRRFSTGSLKSAVAMAVLGKGRKQSQDGAESTGGDCYEDAKEEDASTQKATFGVRVHIVKSGGKLELGKLHDLHQIYRQVVHDELSAQDARIKLLGLLKQPPIYNLQERCAHAFLCGLLICVMSFGGSFLDMWVAGAGCATIAFLQLNTASKNPMYSNIFEISAAMMMSFIARGLSSIKGNFFCYSAISSAGVVLILPGSIVLASSLELASRNIISGSVKMVYAIVYSLFLGFSLTIGSDLFYLVDRSARPRMAATLANITDSYNLPGVFTDDNGQVIFNGTFTFLKPAASVSNTVKYISKGCTRQNGGPWYLQQLPIWSLFILVPIYSVISSLWKLQPLRSKQLPVMVAISCLSYAANKAANRFIFNRSDVVSAIGAFVTGILGNVYARVFRGTAFTAMVTAVSFLVPSGIAAAGGLAQTYEGSEGDQYSTGLALGFRMVQVAIGCTVGLFGAGVVVYSFGSRKRSGYFAF